MKLVGGSGVEQLRPAAFFKMRKSQIFSTVFVAEQEEDKPHKPPHAKVKSKHSFVVDLSTELCRADRLLSYSAMPGTQDFLVCGSALNSKGNDLGMLEIEARFTEILFFMLEL